MWQEKICYGSQSAEIETKMDMDYDHYESNLSSHPNSLTGILKLLIGEIEMSKKYLTKIKSSYLGDNL